MKTIHPIHSSHNKSAQHVMQITLSTILIFGFSIGNLHAEPPKKSVNMTSTWVVPTDADPAVNNFNEPNFIVVPDDVKPKAPLVVFLPGTSGRPANAQAMLSIIAEQGYRVIGLQYNDEPAVVQVCSRKEDPDCSSLFRQQRIYGNTKDAPITNSVEESIVHRLTKLLQYLHQTQPNAHWNDYLKKDSNKQDQPDWSNIVISGLSQGAGMAAYIAKQESVARVVLFSSPWDFYGKSRTLAPWLTTPSATPPERWFAEYHKKEVTADQIAQAYRQLQIPQDHILIFDLEPTGKSTSKNPYHGSTVKFLGYEPQWRWLYGTADMKVQSK